MSLQKRDIFIKHIFTTVAPYVDILSNSFSFGLSGCWRRTAVRCSGIREGDRVLDVCTGTGELAIILSDTVGSDGSVTGADFCESMLQQARNKFAGRRHNVSFILSDAKDLPFRDNTFDAVTVAFGMRNIPDTDLALRELGRVLKPGGVFVCLELTRPQRPWFRMLYEAYIFRIMPFIGRMVVKTAAPYLYLPRSIEAFYPPREFIKLITECGFERVTYRPMTLGTVGLFTALKRHAEREKTLNS